MEWGVLAINTGSTSTKLAFYKGTNCVVREELSHPWEEISSFKDIFGQYEYMMKGLSSFIARNDIRMEEVHAVSARGGHTMPIEGGVYRITKKMLSQIASGNFGRHPCDLSSAMAFEIAGERGFIPIVVDPPVTDELHPLARLSGHPLIERRSRFHALNLKAVARKAAADIKKEIDEVNLIGVHMGGGISVCACRKGRMIDCNNALDGDGPYAPERSGSLPVWDLVELCLSRKYDRREMRKMVVGEGGLMAYVGSKDVLHIEKLIHNGDTRARDVLEGMAYQVAKEVGAMVAVLEGNVDAVYITGGIARSEMITQWIRRRTSFIAPFLVFPGEYEMEALVFGALRVLDGKEKLREI